MAKTHSITVRITEEQKKFIDEKIAHIKSQVDLDLEVPAGLVIRKIIDKAMAYHEARKSGLGKESRGMRGMRSFLEQKHGKGYEKREGKFEDFLKLIEEYNNEEAN
ncbi:MAG TPA: hypothetical protein PLP75_12750 [Burkholderiales bacterium]|nr:hypothetical protein [Burkholderiales bacterium]